MSLYKKKPIIIEAIQFTGKNYNEIKNFVGKSLLDTAGLYIETLEGIHHISINDFVIKGVKGEYYPCKPDIFAATYDKV